MTDHALTQHLDRFPEMEPWDKEGRRFLIATQVSSALADGRYSTREPRWSGDGRRRGWG